MHVCLCMGWGEEEEQTRLFISVTFLPLPSSLWTAAGGREEGVVLPRFQSLSSFGQWLAETRDPGVLQL